MDRMNLAHSLRPYLRSRGNHSIYRLGITRGHTILVSHSCHQQEKPHKHIKESDTTAFSRTGVSHRVERLKSQDALHWPRLKRSRSALCLGEFRKKWAFLSAGQSVESEKLHVRGKLKGCRIMGGLMFLDVEQDRQGLQVMANLRTLNSYKSLNEAEFSALHHKAQRGDYISVFGHPHRTPAGELSIVAEELPEIISPSLSRLPRKLEDPETRLRNRHVDLYVNTKIEQTLRLRSQIVHHVRTFLLQDRFIEFQTPLIADKASGATARPFLTNSSEFPEKQLALRVAPELWLKRLLIGGFDRVFEIGPAFRNEGLDATHNPEFTTCEFYKAYAEIEELMEMTEKLFLGLAELTQSLSTDCLNNIPKPHRSFHEAPFKRISFVPAIEAGLGERLPNLTAEDAGEQVLALFKRHRLPLPSSLTLPRLLDKLSSIYIEPACDIPTFITYHPACLAPLAKSFIDPECKQTVSARAELFINQRELANMYEEENSPIEQRHKFEEQAKWKDEENDVSVDESYLSALTWGLPPSGGWGCGIDRLVMLFSGATRISDVLAFGGLRNVVNLGTKSETKKSIKKELRKDKPRAGSEDNRLEALYAMSGDAKMGALEDWPATVEIDSGKIKLEENSVDMK